MTGSMHFCNDRFVEDAEARVSAHDLGFARGYAIFDVLRTYGGSAFHLSDHLDRFLFGCREIALKLKYQKKDLEHFVNKLLSLNPYEDVSLKLIATAGTSSDGFSRPSYGDLLILVYPLPEAGARAGSYTLQSVPMLRPLPAVKSPYYLPAIIHLEKAWEEGFDEILYTSPERGRVLEASRANIIFIKDQTLITPRSDVLTGITREVIMQRCAWDFHIERREIFYEELPFFEGAFLTSSIQEVVPITAIDGISFDNAGPAFDIQKRFQEYAWGGQWPLLDIEWQGIESFLLNPERKRANSLNEGTSKVVGKPYE